MPDIFAALNSWDVAEGERSRRTFVRIHSDSEVARLNVDDVRLSARKGELRLYGKGDEFREVDIHPKPYAVSGYDGEYGGAGPSRTATPGRCANAAWPCLTPQG